MDDHVASLGSLVQATSTDSASMASPEPSEVVDLYYRGTTTHKKILEHRKVAKINSENPHMIDGIDMSPNRCYLFKFMATVLTLSIITGYVYSYQN